MFHWASRSDQRRRGTTTVEFALCAPLLFLFTFASLEFARVHSIRQTAENAVYEGCRRGIVPGATVADVEAATQLILDAVMVHDAAISVSPSTITEETSQVSVDVEVPIDANSWVLPQFFGNREVHASLTLARERGLNSNVD